MVLPPAPSVTKANVEKQRKLREAGISGSRPPTGLSNIISNKIEYEINKKQANTSVRERASSGTGYYNPPSNTGGGSRPMPRHKKIGGTPPPTPIPIGEKPPQQTEQQQDKGYKEQSNPFLVGTWTKTGDSRAFKKDNTPFYNNPEYFAEKERRRGTGHAMSEKEVEYYTREKVGGTTQQMVQYAMDLWKDITRPETGYKAQAQSQIENIDQQIKSIREKTKDTTLNIGITSTGNYVYIPKGDISRYNKYSDNRIETFYTPTGFIESVLEPQKKNIQKYKNTILRDAELQASSFFNQMVNTPSYVTGYTKITKSDIDKQIKEQSKLFGIFDTPLTEKTKQEMYSTVGQFKGNVDQNKYNQYITRQQQKSWKEAGKSGFDGAGLAITMLSPPAYIAGSIAQGKPMSTAQTGRALWVGSTQFPETVYTVAGGYLEQQTGATAKLFGKGWGTDWNKNFKDLRNTLVTREHQNLINAKNFRTGKERWGFTQDVLFNPAMTDVVYPLATGYAFGAVSGSMGAGSAIAGERVGLTAGKIGMMAIGGTLIAPSGYDIYKTFESGKRSEGFRKIGKLGFQMGLGYAGYKAGRQMPIRPKAFGGRQMTVEQYGSWKKYNRYVDKMTSSKNPYHNKSPDSNIYLVRERSSFFRRGRWQQWKDPTKTQLEYLSKSIDPKNSKFMTPRDWKMVSMSAKQGAIQKFYSKSYFDTASEFSKLNTKTFQEWMIKEQGGVEGIVKNAMISKYTRGVISNNQIKTFTNFLQRGHGFFSKRISYVRRWGVELGGGSSAKRYPVGQAGDLDFNTSRFKYITQNVLLQRHEKFRPFYKASDIKPFIKVGKPITITGFRQPTPYVIDNTNVAPLFKTAVMTGEVGFGLPTASELSTQGVKGVVNASNTFSQMSMIKYGRVSGTPVSNFIKASSLVEQNPLLQSSSRIRYIYGSKSLGQRLLPYVLKGFDRLPGGTQTTVLNRLASPYQPASSASVSPDIIYTNAVLPPFGKQHYKIESPSSKSMFSSIISSSMSSKSSINSISPFSRSSIPSSSSSSISSIISSIPSSIPSSSPSSSSSSISSIISSSPSSSSRSSSSSSSSRIITPFSGLPFPGLYGTGRLLGGYKNRYYKKSKTRRRKVLTLLEIDKKLWGR